MKRILIAAVLCASAAFAEDALLKKWNTCGMANGFYWQDSPGTEQLSFLVGFVNGEAGKDGKDFIWPTGAKVGEIQASLKLFYNESENLPVPISLAIAVTKYRFDGTADAPENYLPRLRNYARTCTWDTSARPTSSTPAHRSPNGT